MELQIHTKEGWQQVVRMAEDMVLYIFRKLPEAAKAEIEEIRKHYPKAGDFKLPEGRPPRIKFSEGIAMLREAGHEAPEDEDIRYDIDHYGIALLTCLARPTKRPLAISSVRNTHPTSLQ